MIKTPVALGLTFCKQLQRESSGEWSLQGVFNSLDFAAFPTQSRRLTVFFALTDGAGEGELRLEILELKRNGESQCIFRKRRWFHFPDDPLMIITGELATNHLVFRSPGEHLAVLTFDAHLVAQRRLPIFLRPG